LASKAAWPFKAAAGGANAVYKAAGDFTGIGGKGESQKVKVGPPKKADLGEVIADPKAGVSIDLTNLYFRAAPLDKPQAPDAKAAGAPSNSVHIHWQEKPGDPGFNQTSMSNLRNRRQTGVWKSFLTRVICRRGAEADASSLPNTQRLALA